MAPIDYDQPARPRQGAILSGEAEVAAPMLQSTLSQSAKISAELGAKYADPAAEVAPAATAKTSAVKPSIPTPANGPAAPKPGKLE